MVRPEEIELIETPILIEFCKNTLNRALKNEYYRAEVGQKCQNTSESHLQSINHMSEILSAPVELPKIPKSLFSGPVKNYLNNSQNHLWSVNSVLVILHFHTLQRLKKPWNYLK